MKEVEFNINQYSKVKLTDVGLSILENDHNHFQELRKKEYRREWSPPKLDDNGYYKCQMWQLMQTFGDHIGLAKHMAFDANIIICLEEDV